jgi:tight adherence protein B
VTALGLLALVAAALVLTLPGRPPGGARSADEHRWPSVRAVLAGPGLRLRRAGRRRDVDLPRVLLELTARLRAGGDLVTAWRRTIGDADPPWAAMLLTAATGEEHVRPAVRRRDRPGRVDDDVAAAAAAFRLARELGAPPGQVLGAVVTGVAELREAQALRRASLAGPRATARLLGWLPLAGIGLGMLLGADPIGVLLGGGAGGAALAAGTTLFVLGHRWVARLVRDAEKAAR